MIASPAYAEQARQVFQTLGSVPHVVFVHESLLSGKSDIPLTIFESDIDYRKADPALDPYNPASYKADWRSDVLRLPDDDVRTAVSRLLEDSSINVVPYQTNA